MFRSPTRADVAGETFTPKLPGGVAQIPPQMRRANVPVILTGRESACLA